MKDTKGKPEAAAHSWSHKALLAKASRYAEEMLGYAHDDWRFAFWSTLTLELVARAVLAKVSPALLADSEDWNNLYYALGYEPRAKRFAPKSIPISKVLERLSVVLPDFVSELAGFCAVHTARRNAELHSGELSFDDLKNATWLAPFYRSCTVLLASMKVELADFFGKEEALVAKQIIEANADETAKAVAGTVAAHRKVWELKEKDDRQTLLAQASVWATRHKGHRVKCPSCEADAIVTGDGIGVPQKAIKDDEITVTQQYLPNRFECVACGLKITGLSHLVACGLGDPYKSTTFYDAAEYYRPDEDYSEHDHYMQYEEDNNEPY